MLFVQTTAPTGWTKVTTHNDKALRVVNSTAGSGGSVSFTTAFASKSVSGSIENQTAGGNVSVSGTVGNTTLSASQIPAHVHTENSFQGYSVASGADFSVFGAIGTPQNTGQNPAPNGESHTHSWSGSSSFTGIAHNHTFTGTPINLAVSYVDVIIATKD
jgi:hypothetical protein